MVLISQISNFLRFGGVFAMGSTNKRLHCPLYVSLFFGSQTRFMYLPSFRSVFLFLFNSLWHLLELKNPPFDNFSSCWLTQGQVFRLRLDNRFVSQSPRVFIIIIIIIIIITPWEFFDTSVSWWFFQWSLSDDKPLLVSNTLLRILSDLNNVVVKSFCLIFCYLMAY